MSHGFEVGQTVKKTMGVRLSGLKVIPNFYDKSTSHLNNQSEYVPVQHADGTKEKFHMGHLDLDEGAIGSAVIGKSKLGSKEAGEKLDRAKDAMYKSLGIKKGSVKKTSTIVGSDGKAVTKVTYESKTTLRELRNSLSEASFELQEVSPEMAHSILTKLGGHGNDFFDMPSASIADLDVIRRKAKYGGQNKLGRSLNRQFYHHIQKQAAKHNPNE